MLTFLIMAGGKGERFFPLSTPKKPKQLLKIFSDKSLIRLAYERILPLVESNKQIFVSTNEIQLEELKKELPELDNSNIIVEPGFRDTASAVSYGSLVISKYFKNPTICVLASDHLIKEDEKFRQVIKIAFKKAEEDAIVTLGIKPEYPETGYGYIESSGFELNNVYKVKSFKEKPDLKTAKKYLDLGNYLWNSGMFIFKYSTILKAFKKYSKGHYDIMNSFKFEKNEGISTMKENTDLFLKYPKISIDFAVMEKADNIYTIPSSFGWSDVGSYKAFEDLYEKDENLNVILNSKCVSVDSKNNIIISDNSDIKINLVGISDKIVVITKTDLLVCEKSHMQDIKKLLK